MVLIANVFLDTAELDVNTVAWEAGDQREGDEQRLVADARRRVASMWQ